MSTVDGDVLAERLLQVIDEGRRVATYKLALLLALVDASAAGVDDQGHAPDALHTRVIARHVLRLYLPQVRTFLAASGDALDLKQISGNRSAVTGAVLGLHLGAETNRVRGLGAIERLMPREYDRCLDEVELTFARFPLLRLQVVGREHRPFLYDVDWTESVSLTALHAGGGGLVRFRRDAADHLLRLAPLVRPLVEHHWTRMVAQLNHIDTEAERLHEHLFGATRSTFPKPLREGLLDLQDGRCFYCAEPLPARTQVDHFVPWSRWANDAVENLVLADVCNSHKRHYLPAPVHLARWAARMERSGGELEALARSCGWESDRVRSTALARTCYAHLPAGTPLWRRGAEFVDGDAGEIAGLLSALAAP